MVIEITGNLDLSDLSPTDKVLVYLAEKAYAEEERLGAKLDGVPKTEFGFYKGVFEMLKGNIASADTTFKIMYGKFLEKSGVDSDDVGYEKFMKTVENFTEAHMRTIKTYQSMYPLVVGTTKAAETGNLSAIFDAYYRTLDNEFDESLDPETYPLSAPTPTVVEPTGTPTPAVVEPTGAAPTPGETSDRDETGYLPGDSKGKATNDFRNMGF